MRGRDVTKGNYTEPPQDEKEAMDAVDCPPLKEGQLCY